MGPRQVWTKLQGKGIPQVLGARDILRAPGEGTAKGERHWKPGARRGCPLEANALTCS